MSNKDAHIINKTKIEMESENRSMSSAKIVSYNINNDISPLEEEYIRLYGKEFVDDLNWAYHRMRRDVKNQSLTEEEVLKNRDKFTTMGQGKRFFFVDMDNMDMYTMSVDDDGGKTIYNYGNSPVLNTNNDNNNIRYLLSGIMVYDTDRAKKWLEELLGPGERIWYEKI